MVDFLFTLGQAASALFLLYGGFLVLLPVKQPSQAKTEEMGLPHLRMHA